jgi:hypothetical protein
LLFVVAHVGALAFDSFVGFDWDDLLVPFASAWRPAAVAWGVVAAYLLVAVEVTSLLMRHLRRGLWHAVHLLSLVVFGAVTLHALYAGADAQEPLVQAFATGSATVVVLLVLVRLAWRPRTVRPAPPPEVAELNSERDAPSFLGIPELIPRPNSAGIAGAGSHPRRAGAGGPARVSSGRARGPGPARPGPRSSPR